MEQLFTSRFWTKCVTVVMMLTTAGCTNGSLDVCNWGINFWARLNMPTTMSWALVGFTVVFITFVLIAAYFHFGILKKWDLKVIDTFPKFTSAPIVISGIVVALIFSAFAARLFWEGMAEICPTPDGTGSAVWWVFGCLIGVVLGIVLLKGAYPHFFLKTYKKP